MKITSETRQRKTIVIKISARSDENYNRKKQRFLEENDCLQHYDCIFVKIPFGEHEDIKVEVI